MSLYRKYQVDSVLEKNGAPMVPEDAEKNGDGTWPTFFVARAGGENSRFSEAWNEVWKPFRDQQAAGTVPKETVRENTIKVFIHGCLRGWENVYDEGGKLLEYNEANALKLFGDLPELLNELQDRAARRDAFLKFQTKVAAKN